MTVLLIAVIALLLVLRSEQVRRRANMDAMKQRAEANLRAGQWTPTQEPRT